MSDYRVDDLARVAGTTVRNVRAYQDKGLLPAPRREGRAVWYSEEHLERLRAILGLLDRGYTLASIGELLEAEAEGLDVEHLVHVGQALLEPYVAEEARRFTLTELADLFGADHDALGAINRGVELGILRPDGDALVTDDPGLLDACSRLVRAGVPVNAAIDAYARLREQLDAVAEGMVDLVATHVLEPALLDDRGVPRMLDSDTASTLADVVREVRPIATGVATAELGHALERAIAQRVRERLD